MEWWVTALAATAVYVLSIRIIGVRLGKAAWSSFQDFKESDEERRSPALFILFPFTALLKDDLFPFIRGYWERYQTGNRYAKESYIIRTAWLWALRILWNLLTWVVLAVLLPIVLPLFFGLEKIGRGLAWVARWVAFYEEEEESVREDEDMTGL
ncbi:MAG TPA: hypothetical protein VJB99_02735 [Patescibacteria group bacterium]|nr:hypothetical protein [Patescibacteria group bacterium]